MDEIEYIRRIDAHFPFRNGRKWKAVIDQSINISDNAAYMALHAIVVGRPSRLALSETQRMIDYWSSRYDHPAKSIVLTAARAILSNEFLSEQESLKYLDAVAVYRGLYNAVAIIYAAAKPDDRLGSVPDVVERRWREIIACWGGRRKWGQPPGEE